MSELLDRIEMICKNEGIGLTAMEKAIGASKGVLSRAIRSGTDIQSKWLKSIVENYPRYSAEWLIVGSGKMLKQDLYSLSDQETEAKELQECRSLIREQDRLIGSLEERLRLYEAIDKIISSGDSAVRSACDALKTECIVGKEKV